MKKNTKIFRIGHRLPRKQGVITIASTVFPDTGEIFYGASFCHPKEKVYDKRAGIAQALERLDTDVEMGLSLKLENEITHSKVLNEILMDMVYDDTLPKWTESLILEQLAYPSGLKRFPIKGDSLDDVENKFGISKIVVNSEYAKEQLMLALDYMESSEILDDNFVSIRMLLEMSYIEDLIEVKD